MNVSFQQANPRTGAESFLLRFEEPGRRTACMLVDAGQGVDLDELLGDDDYLVASLLTHAHSDHYQSLDTVLRDGAPIHTSPATAAILETVLDGANRGSLSVDTEATRDAVAPVDGWTQLLAGLRICPIPAGHTPGAVGFVIEFEDGGDEHYIVATGDFTRRRVAGYPGFDFDLPIDVEALFLTASTSDDFEPELTEAIGMIVERVRAGSSTLVTASALTGVHCAYLLANLPERFDPPKVILAGQVAKLFDALDYRSEQVETVPTFDDPTELLAPETVTIAGPEVPLLDRSGTNQVQGAGARAADGGSRSLPQTSAGQLFGAIRSDPAATLVQLLSGSYSPIETADCTVASYRLSNHPTEATVDVLVEAFDPTEIVIEHQPIEEAKQYREDYASIVWAVDSTDVFELYDGEWQAPPWMTPEGQRLARNGSTAKPSVSIDGFDEQALPLSSLTRIDEPDIKPEGLDVEQLATRLRITDRSDRHNPESKSRSVADRSDGATDVSLAESSCSTATSSSPPSTFEQVIERLDAIEATLSVDEEQRFTAKVIDAGDGITLLRVIGDLDVPAGESVTVTIQAESNEDS